MPGFSPPNGQDSADRRTTQTCGLATTGERKARLAVFGLSVALIGFFPCEAPGQSSARGRVSLRISHEALSAPAPVSAKGTASPEWLSRGMRENVERVAGLWAAGWDAEAAIAWRRALEGELSAGRSLSENMIAATGRMVGDRAVILARRWAPAQLRADLAGDERRRLVESQSLRIARSLVAASRSPP